MTEIDEQRTRDFARLGIVVRSIENDLTTIDAFLPNDLAVDLVKIDIEGHEPLAIRGMARTIARSPRLRFIIVSRSYGACPQIPRRDPQARLPGLQDPATR
jgi:hypothetical protein